MNVKSLHFVPTLLVIGYTLILLLLAGQLLDDSAFCKAKLYEILSEKLKEDFPNKVQSEDLEQGQHVAVVYDFGTTGNVVEWYFQTKWKYSDQ